MVATPGDSLEPREVHERRLLADIELMATISAAISMKVRRKARTKSRRQRLIIMNMREKNAEITAQRVTRRS